MRADINITAKVIADSINRFGNRLTTFAVTHPRILLVDILKHRELSITTVSNPRLSENVKANTYFPSAVIRSESTKEVDAEIEDRFRQEWLLGASVMCGIVETMDKMSISKRISSRLLESFQYVTSLITASELANFFSVACSSPQHEMQALGFKMLAEYVNGLPDSADDHIPFGNQMDYGLSSEEKKLVACARCSRIGYGALDAKEDLRLANELIHNKNFNPFEHVARAHINDTFVGGYRGWIPYRKQIQGEHVVWIDYEKLLLTRPSFV